MKFSIAHKLGLSFVLLVLISAGVVGGLFYQKTTDILIGHVLDDIADDMREAGSLLLQIVGTRDEDVLFLASTPPIQGLIRTRNTGQNIDQDKSTYEQWVRRLQIIFQSQLQRKRTYLSIRFLDAKGEELVHVARDGENIIHYTAGQLQNKSKRTYFRNSIGLPLGAVYVSEVNLNREFGRVITPHQEVVRSVTPVYDERTGKFAGMVAITAEIGEELRTIQKLIGSQDESKIFITNDKGSYLLHPDVSKAYGFDLGKLYRIQDDIPQLARFYSAENSTRQVTLMPEDTDGKQLVNFSKIPFDANNPDRFIAVILTQEYSSVVAKQSDVLADVAFWAVLLIVAGAASGLLLSMRISRPIKQIVQVMDDYTHDRKISKQLPVNQEDEMGLLAQSYQSLIKQVEDARENLEETVAERTHELNRFKTTLDETMDCVFMFEPDTLVFFYVNAGAIKQVGYTQQELLKMTPYDIKPEYNEQQFREMIAPMIAGKQPVVNFETIHQHKDGHIIPVEIFLQYISPAGEAPRFVAIVRDITERKQVDKMKNEFISTVSHELRTPLTSIRGSLGLLVGGKMGELPESAKEMLDIASNNTERLLLLINDILDIQKIESGKMNFNFGKLEVNSFIQQAITDFSAYAEQYNVSFVITKLLDNAFVFADKDRLIQVMSNLLSNAVKFSHSGDQVKVSVARHHDDRIQISVTDFGEGIPEDFQEILFDRFTQLDSSDSRAKGGTGLGLSISKVIVEKHGGRLGFVSKRGIGSTFYIELPELMGEVKPANTVLRELPAEHVPCVLIVEDDANVATLIMRMLTEAGYHSDVAYDAREARQLLAKKGHLYNLMTLDIMLPDEDGISLLTSLRQDVKTHDLPVVVLSVKADEAKRELSGGAIGVVDWLSKPIDQHRLLDVVRSIVTDNHLPRVLHVEDEEDVYTIVKHMLEDQCEVTWTRNVADSREVIRQGNFDLVLLDIGLPDGSGLELLKDIEESEIPPQVIIFSANDVPKEYAAQVDAVLIKSKTSNARLLDILFRTMKK